MTTAVVFDLDWTLVAFDPGTDGILADAFDRADVDPSLAEPFRGAVRERMAAFHDEPFRAAAVDAGIEDPAAFARAYEAAVLDATYLPAGVPDALDALAGAGHPLAVLTNGHAPLQRRKLERVGLDGRFDAVLAASELGVRKPDRRAFRAVRDRLPADAYAFVGDSPDHDIEPAADLGFRTVRVGEPHPAADAALPRSSLDRLPRLL